MTTTVTSEYESIMADRKTDLVEVLVNCASNLSMGDIQAGFPSEDFLSDDLKSLANLIRHAKTAPKAGIIVAMRQLYDEIEYRQLEVVRDAEYALEEYKTAAADIKYIVELADIIEGL